jgi:hypothetical protein
VNDLAVVGDRAYLAAGGAGLLAVDVSNPRAPVEIGAWRGHFARRVRVVGERAFVASEQSGLWVVDLTDPLDEGRVFDTWGSADALAVAAGHVFVADQAGGLVVVRSAAALAALEEETREVARSTTTTTVRPALAGWLSYAACRFGADPGAWLEGTPLSGWRPALASACRETTSPPGAGAASLSPVEVHGAATRGAAAGSGASAPGW